MWFWKAIDDSLGRPWPPRHTRRRWWVPAAAGLLVAALSGCASVSVTGERLSATRAPRTEPEVLWVRDFGYRLTRNQTREHGRELPAFLDAQASRLTTATVTELRKSGFRAGGLGRSHPLPPRGWLVAGNITQLDVGDRWARTGVGFGQGATRLDTEVRVYDLSARAPGGGLGTPFYVFHTTGGSGIAPGVVPGVVVSGAVTPVTVVGGTLKARADLTTDTRRTGRMISGALQDYMADNALIPPRRQRQHAKRKGDYTGSWFDAEERRSLTLPPRR
jgi:hypothetical protein